MRVSIIVPAYNEEKRISKFLKNYLDFFERIKRQRIIDNFEIIIVINNTQDQTEKIIQTYQKKTKSLKYFNFKQGGKGFAIIEGFKEALKSGNELIGFVDADMSTSPLVFFDLVKNIKNYDGIIANRRDKRSLINPKQSFFRRVILAGGYNLLVRTLFLFPYKDTQCGAKLFKRKLIEDNVYKLKTYGWGFDIALLYCLRKESQAKIISIPTVWHDEEGSHINLRKTPLDMLFSALKLRLIHSPAKSLIMQYTKLKNKRLKNELVKK